MTAPVLPYSPGLVRAVLVADAAFTALLPANRLTTRAPSDVTSVFGLVRPAGVVPLDVSAGAWSPLVQVDVYCPPGGAVDPEVVVWRVAASAAAILSRARNVAAGSTRWSARVTDGPTADVDTSRGSSAPLYRAFIRAELTLHVR